MKNSRVEWQSFALGFGAGVATVWLAWLALLTYECGALCR